MTKISSPSEHKRESNRRKFLKTVVLGAGATLLPMAFGSMTAFGSGHADALLLSCMDYRLIDHTRHYMVVRGLRDKYDHVVLAGASLGAITDKYPEWNKTFWDHLSLAIKLHSIHRVMVLDHRECGAYQLILGEGCCDTRDKETAVHRIQLTNLEKAIKKSHPELKVELLLMDLNGTVEIISSETE